MTNDFTAYDPAQLPAPVLSYLDAHDEGRHDDARSCFSLAPTVVDDGNTYRGVDEIGEWIERASGEYEYTSTRIGQRQEDDAHITVQIRLDGNFPGGTVTLRYHFELDDQGITRLTIEV
ncbi:nuclear transport factor 2 family protein [Ruania halotolerans]|uniref:nuclear transport factor 2 family protein n=1 Tax=Ruania halotolerans TaxID=2897773 RepID=UPI001E4ADD1A|nr:nuclear transport factor 2 family protein [Ruania halotolerans]UFU07467.1 nuclear transport factor 2 family protein [Ruania halotolerans]